MSSDHFEAMTWELVDAEFGPEPGVFWDRDMADCGWEPLLYVQETREVKITRNLRAHCPLHRAPDRWPVADGSFGLLMRCECMQWKEGEWEPRFSGEARAKALDLEVARLVEGGHRSGSAPGTARFIRSALVGIPGVLAVDVLDGTPGRVVVVLILEGIALGRIETSLIEQVAREAMPKLVAANVSWEVRTRIATEEEMARLEEEDG